MSLLAIDQGTSSSRAIIFSDTGDIKAVYQTEIALSYPQRGWVEQDPQELWDVTKGVILQALSGDRDLAAGIRGAGITNQRETTILWDRHTGKAVYNAIVWQDRRTAAQCQALKEAGQEDMIRQKTGLLLDPYFSATKIAWILDNVEGVRARAAAGDLLFGTVDSFLLWHLTGGRVHLSDSTNASRTMLYNIHTHDWDDDLLALFDIPRALLPDIRPNISDFGVFDSDIFGRDIPIGGVAGDQSAAMIGQGCLTQGMLKVTYGTGCFALLNTGQAARESQHRLLTTVAFRVGDVTHYALEGSIFNAGTAIQFLRDNFCFFEHAKETEAMARSVDDNGGVFFVPAFTGLGAPHWNPDARGLISGLTRDTQKAHVVRAALEAQACQTRDLLDAMTADSGEGITRLRVDGGLVANAFMCQAVADITQITVDVPIIREASAWGAACLAGVQAGVFEALEDAAALWRSDRLYTPEYSAEESDIFYALWQGVIAKTT